MVPPSGNLVVVDERLHALQRKFEAVDDLILSQDGEPQTRRTTRQIARETGIHRSSVSRIVHKDLGLKCLK